METGNGTMRVRRGQESDRRTVPFPRSYRRRLTSRRISSPIQAPSALLAITHGPPMASTIGNMVPGPPSHDEQRDDAPARRLNRRRSPSPRQPQPAADGTSDEQHASVNATAVPEFRNHGSCSPPNHRASPHQDHVRRDECAAPGTANSPNREPSKVPRSLTDRSFNRCSPREAGSGRPDYPPRVKHEQRPDVTDVARPAGPELPPRARRAPALGVAPSWIVAAVAKDRPSSQWNPSQPASFAESVGTKNWASRVGLARSHALATAPCRAASVLK